MAAGLIGVWLSRRRGGPDGHHGGIRAIRRRLRQACLEGNAGRARTLLLQWGRERWPADPPANLHDIGRRCHPDLEQAILGLSRTLYGQGAGEWEGERFWQVFRRTASGTGAAGEGDQGRLEPLYRL